MYSSVDQGRIIGRINRYLRWHNLPLKFNKGGVCHGLASVFVKYTLEGRQKAFFEMLEYIANQKQIENHEDEVNHFIAEVILSFTPETYHLSFSQNTSTEMLKINSKPITANYQLGLVTSKKNWQTVFETLQLQQNETMLLTAYQHTVALSKTAKGYLLYDPNYSSGFREFSNEESLLTELNKVFASPPEPWAMKLSILNRPDTPPRNFPPPSFFYEQFLNESNINATSLGKNNRTTLEMAASFNDPESIKKLLDLGAIDCNDRAIAVAIINNNTLALQPLLEKLQDDEVRMLTLACVALTHGAKASFDTLLQHPKISSYFNGYVLENFPAILRYATQGQNPKLLQQVLQMYRLHPEQQEDAESLNHAINHAILSKDLFKIAIEKGTTECISVLGEQLKKTGHVFTDEQKLHYILQAVQKNHPFMVSTLIDQLDIQDLSRIDLSPRTVKKTDLSILKLLKEYGVLFSKHSEGIIAEKEHIPLGFFDKIGLMLWKFSDFMKEIFSKSAPFQIKPLPPALEENTTQLGQSTPPNH